MPVLATASAVVRLGRMGMTLHRMRSNANTAEVRTRTRQHLATIAAEHRGLSAKLGQLLTSDSESELAACQQDLPALPLAGLVDQLDAAWKQPHQDVVEQIAEATAAASLGQVHHATLQSTAQHRYGAPQEVAIKIRYPDIDRHLSDECSAMGLIPAMGPMRRWGFDVAGYKNWMRESLMSETDYVQESQVQSRYYQLTQRYEAKGQHSIAPLVKVPQVFTRLCNQGVLVQEWLPGLSLDQAAQQLSDLARQRLARNLIQHLLLTSLKHGFLHADLHPGNVAIQPSSRLPESGSDQPQVILYDYGCVLQLSPSERQALTCLVQGTMDRQPMDLVACLSDLGFDPDKLQHIEAQLPALCSALCEPFVVDAPFDVSQWRLHEHLQAILGEQTWWFRAAGPPRFLLIMRTIQGLTKCIQSLRVQVNWHREWRAISDQMLPNPRHQPYQATTSIRTPANLAKSLRVRVTRNGESRVDLKMPITVLENITSVIDDDLQQRISAQGSDITALAQNAMRQGYPQGELFTCQDNDKYIQVSME